MLSDTQVPQRLLRCPRPAARTPSTCCMLQRTCLKKIRSPETVEAASPILLPLSTFGPTRAYHVPISGAGRWLELRVGHHGVGPRTRPVSHLPEGDVAAWSCGWDALNVYAYRPFIHDYMHTYFFFTCMYPCMRASLMAEEIFTYIDRVGEDKQQFEQWLLRHDAVMQRLRTATEHLWFRAYCMLNKVGLVAFLDPSTAFDMLTHWDFWVIQQDCCALYLLNCYVLLLYAPQ